MGAPAGLRRPLLHQEPPLHRHLRRKRGCGQPCQPLTSADGGAACRNRTDDLFPAADLVGLYHERWEIESAYLALRHTLLIGHVLRSQDRPGLEQEIWALLTVYQLLRMAMVEAVETRPGTDPGRASFTTALQTARDCLTAARGIHPDNPTDGPADQPGVIGRAVLTTLLPARRRRFSARKVKNATSRYLNRDDGRPSAPTAVTAIEIRMHAPQPLNPARRPRLRRAPSRPRAPRPPTRRDRVTALLGSDPRRAWSGTELAQKLKVPKHNMLTQLAEWTRLGFLTRTHAGNYALDPPPPAEPSPPDPGAPANPDGGSSRARCSAHTPARTNNRARRQAESTLPAPPESDTPTPATSWTRTPTS